MNASITRDPLTLTLSPKGRGDLKYPRLTEGEKAE